MFLRRLLAGLLVTTVLAAAACAEPQDESPRVVAAFYALEYAAAEVAGPHFAVEALTTPGVDAHDLELSPRQIASLADADLVVYLKGFQPAVDDAIEQSGAANVLDVTPYAHLLSPEDHEGHDHEDDDHDHGDVDPHFWLDPERLADVGRAIADHLPGTDAQRSEFAANADDFAALMGRIDEDFAAGLAQCRRTEFITSHTAFGYLAARYGLTEIGINGINPDAEASPARIAEVQRLATEHGVTTIFFETLASPAVATAIAGDLGLKTAVLDPIEGVSDQSPGTDYPSIMEANLRELRAANDCR